MRSVAAVLFILIGACTYTEALGSGTTVAHGGPASPTTDAPTTTTTTLVITTTTESPVTTTTVERPGDDALVTPTGVVVAVLEQTVDGFLVRTPCGNETVVSSGTPVRGVWVVVDPGHGGEVDTGAVGANGLMEQDLNLVVSQALEAKLIVRGIPVLLTRTGRYGSTLGARTALADHVGADLLLSVHHNAPTQGPSNRPGTEIFVQHDSTESRRLGGLVWEHITEALSQFDVQWTAARDAGVLSVLSTRGEDAYGINRGPETVSVLAELGYVSNPPEAELFATDEYVETAAEALANAVMDYLTTQDAGAGFVSEPRVFNPQPGIGAGACVDPVLE
ncbi:MAG TPA: N-acetylmuramoyl-L-alanine amidase [Acidimicrobiia bacterium]|jgi:N-acetylmuramoyl-L-alanine amidase